MERAGTYSWKMEPIKPKITVKVSLTVVLLLENFPHFFSKHSVSRTGSEKKISLTLPDGSKNLTNPSLHYPKTKK